MKKICAIFEHGVQKSRRFLCGSQKNKSEGAKYRERRLCFAAVFKWMRLSFCAVVIIGARASSIVCSPIARRGVALEEGAVRGGGRCAGGSVGARRRVVVLEEGAEGRMFARRWCGESVTAQRGGGGARFFCGGFHWCAGIVHRAFADCVGGASRWRKCRRVAVRRIFA